MIFVRQNKTSTSNLKIMFNEEIDMTLETAVKVRTHLIRLLSKEHHNDLVEKLIYVDKIIKEVSEQEDKDLVFA